MSQSGQLLQADYMNNVGGLNQSDTPFVVKDDQAVDGSNYSYIKTGAIKKRNGHSLINSVADTSLLSLGLGLNNSATGTKFNVRAADRHLQSVDITVPSFTNLSDDSAVAGTNFLAANTTTPVLFSQFNTPSNSVLWAIGGGMTSIYGVVSTTKVTANGVAAPTGVFTANVNTSAGGSFPAAGEFTYALLFRKRSTQAQGNVALDVSATTVNTDDTVTLDWSGLTNYDQTLYDEVVIYRSAISGVSGFTTGDIIAQVAGPVTSYIDLGTYISTSQNVPRAGNVILDNSPPVAGPYNGICVWKRHLVVAVGSTLYCSDLNKPESWPLAQTIAIASGGNITGLAIISFNTTTSATGVDEFLCIFKERELWVVTGEDLLDGALKFVDTTGAASQALVVPGNGFLAWIDYRGVYMWDGSGKPVYISRPIEPLFAFDGLLDKSQLNRGIGQFFRKENLIIWFLSHKTFGVNKFQIKLDLRLTLPVLQQNLAGRISDGVFIYDTTAFPVFATLSFLPAVFSDEILLLGDASGFLYKGFNGASDNSASISFKYKTKFHDCGNPNVDKRFNTVVVWVEEVGDWNLTLDWWTNYRSSEGIKSTRALPISTADQRGSGIWDISFWDVGFWDEFVIKPIPLFFYLSSDAVNNSEGKCIQLQFRQEAANQPVTILGYSLMYNEMGMNRGTN